MGISIFGSDLCNDSMGQSKSFIFSAPQEVVVQS